MCAWVPSVELIFALPFALILLDGADRFRDASTGIIFDIDGDGVIGDEGGSVNVIE